MSILGFDPGKNKCGIAVMESNGKIHFHRVFSTGEVEQEIKNLRDRYGIEKIVIGDQTMAKQWRDRLTPILTDTPIILVDERYSSLEARDRYWQMYPPKFWQRLIPQGMRQPPRPIDDIVAIILVERFLAINPI
jgi:RNase H-fold protein (predicted Holliday junction resolvase)